MPHRMLEPSLEVTAEEDSRDKGHAFKEEDSTGQSNKDSKNFDDLTTYDLKTFRALHNQYKHVLEENQISALAQFASIREAAVVVVIIFFTSLGLGTWYVKYRAGCTVAQGLLFTAYTITSAGFGSVVIPKTDEFLFFAVFYVFVGITIVAVVAAQALRYLEAAAIRYGHMTDKSENATKGLKSLKELLEADKDAAAYDVQIRKGLVRALQSFQKNLSKFDRNYRLRPFLSIFRKFPCLAYLIVPSYLIFLIVLGAVTMYNLEEGWTPVQALYFACFAMSTVGYGDVYPVTSAGTWFTALWLPLNVSFLALFLGSVAHYYVKFSNWNVRRIEADLRKENRKPKKQGSVKIVTMQAERSRNDIEGSRVLGVDHKGHDSVTTLSVIEGESRTPGRDAEQGKLPDEEQTLEFNLSTLFDLQAQGEEMNQAQSPSRHLPRRKLKKELSVLTFGEGDEKQDVVELSLNTTLELLHFLGVAGNSTESSGEKKPDSQHPPNPETLALMLRFRVLERVAKIVAFENTQHDEYDVQGNDLIITIEKLREVAPKWYIPYRARKSFRDVYCNAILFVGDRNISRKGADAFFALNPFDFSNLFSPFVAAFEDSRMMEGWLARSEDLAVSILPPLTISSNNTTSTSDENEDNDGLVRNKRYRKNTIEAYFPCNLGNAVMAHFTATNN